MTLSPQDASRITRQICSLAPIVPVLVIDKEQSALPLAEALVSGGLPAIEVTLRTPAALDSIRAIAQLSGGHVGAGTLITPEDVRAAKEAGATFGVSPGSTDALLAACEMEGLHCYPVLLRPVRRCVLWTGDMTCLNSFLPKLQVACPL